MPVSTKDIKQILKLIAAFGIGSTLAIGGFIVAVLGVAEVFLLPEALYAGIGSILGGALILAIESIRDIFVKKADCKDKDIEIQKLKNKLDKKE